MFGDRHYVPVLRLKRAERQALRHLAEAVKPLLTPLLECPASVVQSGNSSGNLVGRIEQLAQESTAGWAGRRMFCDFSMLSGHPHPFELFSAFCGQSEVVVVPVVGIASAHHSTYRSAVESTLSLHDAGLCLRVSLETLRLPSVFTAIETVLAGFGGTPERTDLIIDRGLVARGCVRFSEVAHLVPAIHAWRSVTVLAGSFPRDLKELRPGHHRLRRVEWLQWLADRETAGLMRRPAFGDYVIQHPYYAEPPSFANVSASIRYTTSSEYLILRGEGVLNEDAAGYSQWPAQAMLLTDLPDFRGADFSYGDEYIAERASNPAKTGNARTWLMAGISHHVTLAAQLVAQVDLVHEASDQMAASGDSTEGVSPDSPGP